MRRAAPLRASGLDAEQVNEKVAELVKSAQVGAVCSSSHTPAPSLHGPPQTKPPSPVHLDQTQKTWEKTDDKPAAVAVTAAALVALITASSVADTIVSCRRLGCQACLGGGQLTAPSACPLLVCLSVLLRVCHPVLTTCRTASPSSAT